MIEATRRAMKDARTFGLQARVAVLEEKNHQLHGIIVELIKAHLRCEADSIFLSIIGSYGDTLEDSEILQLLKDWNATGKVMQERQ